MTHAATPATTQTYRVWIKASPTEVWSAIVDPLWVDRYGYGGIPHYGDLSAGTDYTLDAGAGMVAAGVSGPIVDGTIVEAIPHKRFKATWRMLMDPSMAAEATSTVTYDIAVTTDGVTKLTVTHELPESPITARLVAGGAEEQGAGGGWAWILSDLKSLLETGTAFSR